MRLATNVIRLSSEPELSQDLVGRRQERRPGVVRLVAKRAIELARVRDRLVNRQPQVRRVQHEIPRPGFDRRRGQLGDGLVGVAYRALRTASGP